MIASIAIWLTIASLGFCVLSLPFIVINLRRGDRNLDLADAYRRGERLDEKPLGPFLGSLFKRKNQSDGR